MAGALIRVNRYFDMGGRSPRLRSADRDFHAVTDSEGRFRFEELSVERTELLLNGEMIPTPQRMALASIVDLEHVVFRVPALCHVRVFMDSDPLAAESLSLLDSSGETVMMTIMADSTTLGAHAVGLEGGRSDLIQTDESVATIVLYKGGLEVRRVPVELAPGPVNEIRL